MESLIGPITSGIISAIVASFGCYVAITNRLTRLETMLELLTKEVEKHNQVIERTFKIEGDLKTAFKRIDEHRDKIERLESIVIGGIK